MNNIRKIIKERLENARNDYHNTSGMIEAIIKTKLQGQIEAYQDCLNLMQPRTEQKILKDFEALGWNVDDGYVNFTLKKTITKNNTFGEYICYCYISINKENQTYHAEQRSNWNTEGYNLSMQEHKLLSELFEVIFE